jgi:hypothetical protein
LADFFGENTYLKITTSAPGVAGKVFEKKVFGEKNRLFWFPSPFQCLRTDDKWLVGTLKGSTMLDP